MSEVEFSRRRLGGLAAVAAATGAAVVAGTPSPALAVQPVPWFDVRDYGAVGSGAVNDRPAIQAAVDAAAAAGGGIVLAPTGNYRLDTAVTFPTNKAVDLVGAGRWLTRFTLNSGSAGLRFGTLGSGGGSSTGRTGGFWVHGGGVGGTAMNISTSSNRTFYDIQISNSLVGLAVEGCQNAVFEELWVHDCGIGLVLDYGAGGNLFNCMQLRDNATNMQLQNSSNASASFPYNGRPTDNKFVGGIIEGGGVTNHVVHGAGVDNYFIGTRFAGSTCPRIKFYHQDISVSGGWKGSFDLNLIGCFFVNGTGIEHTSPFTTVRLVDCKFQSMTTAFVLGNGCWIETDSYNGVAVTNRFANAPGGTDPEESLVRHEAYFPENVTRPAATNNAFQAWVGTGPGGSREANPRYAVKASGDVAWGPGTAAADVTLKRSATGILQASGKLTAVGGLGVGNSAAATTPGSVVKKIQVFDASGTSLGFIPVYNTIT
jgi:hypothetical protein